jgi:hypothetical protein
MEHEETTAAELTPAAQKFLRDHIQSVWQLELILFLRDKSASLSIAEIATQLYSNPRMIESAISSFVKDGILKERESQPVAFTYEPDSLEMMHAIEQACAAYANKRLSVINFIFSKDEGSQLRA